MTGSVDVRGGILDTGSLVLYNNDGNFTANSNGTITFNNSASLGTYSVNYTFNTTLSGSVCTTPLTSNLGLLRVNLLNNCNFAISGSEFID
jgi:hypothetical protein